MARTRMTAKKPSTEPKKQIHKKKRVFSTYMNAVREAARKVNPNFIIGKESKQAVEDMLDHVFTTVMNQARTICLSRNRKTMSSPMLLDAVRAAFPMDLVKDIMEAGVGQSIEPKKKVAKKKTVAKNKN